MGDYNGMRGNTVLLRSVGGGKINLVESEKKSSLTSLQNMLQSFGRSMSVMGSQRKLIEKNEETNEGTDKQDSNSGPTGKSFGEGKLGNTFSRRILLPPVRNFSCRR